MLLFLFLFFVVLPFAELYLLLEIGHAIGAWQTLAIVIVAGFFGGALVRYEGLRVFKKARETMARGEVPTDSMVDGILVITGGILLITPGVLTDLLGVLLIFPLTRVGFAKLAKAWARKQIAVGKIDATGFDEAFMNPLKDVIDVPSEEVSSKKIPEDLN